MTALASVTATDQHTSLDDPDAGMTLFDFRNPSKLGRERVRRLELMHETFQRSMAARLGGLLRTMIRLDPLAVDQITYDEYVRAMPNPTVIGLFGFEGIEGRLLVEMSTSTALTLVDRLLGGLGAPGVVRRPTEVETSLIEEILRVAEGCIDETFQPVLPVSTRLDSIEYNPNFAQAAGPADMVVVLSYALATLEGYRFDGLVTVCYPFSLLEPAWEMAGDLDEKVPALEMGYDGPRVAERLPAVTVPLSVRLRASSVSAGEFSALEPGDVLRLDHRIDDPVIAYVAGSPLLEGRLGQKNNNVAIEIANWSTQ